MRTRRDGAALSIHVWLAVGLVTLVVVQVAGTFVAVLLIGARAAVPAGVVFAVLSFAVVGLGTRRLVTQPLANTGNAARQIAEGDLDVSLSRSAVSEIADVHAAFRSMSAALRESLERQAALEMERRQFIGAVVHDLRTPLFSLAGYLEGLEQGLADSPEQRARYVKGAREKTARLERLVSNLFDYTRFDFLDMPLALENVDLAALLRAITDDLQPRAESLGVRLELSTSGDECMLACDRHLIARAVENLLDNALRYTPAGGSVHVRYEATADGVSFCVSDSGPGIPPDELPLIFDPLYRGNGSREGQSGGLGLGLSICRRIINAHGGELTAQNRPGGGGAFRATVPRGLEPRGHSYSA